MANDELAVNGWHLRRSDGGRGLWYATRTGKLPGEPPEGFAMTVFGRTEGDLRNAVSRQIALDRQAARAGARLTVVP